MHRHSTSLAPALVLALVATATGCDENRTVPSHDDYVSPTPPILDCLPNLDGRIDASEIVTAYDTTVRFLVTPYGVVRPVDVAGVVDNEGRLRWDWSLDYVDDQVASVVPETLANKWYAASFPGGEIAAPSDAGRTLESVLRQDDEGLWLLGIASTEPDPPEGRTLLVYDAPVSVLRFPLQPGLEFVSTGEVHGGLIYGLQYAGRDIYEVSVDATGHMILPQLEFTQAHRVRTRVTIEPAVGTSVSRRQVSFYSECFAEVARATSLDDELAANFTQANEIWRLGL